jgi:hypothetical protein
MNAEDEKNLAKRLFNECWDLIDKPDRSESENVEMLRLAVASRLHWEKVGGPIEKAIGEWQCSRVNSILGDGEAALQHAIQSRDFTNQIESPHFMYASSTEALAYANFVLGNMDLAKKLKQDALALTVGLEAEDAAHIQQQINELPF